MRDTANCEEQVVRFEGFTRIQDARWARPPNPKKAPRRMRDITKIFTVGDVAPFHLRELSEKDGDEPGSLRVALYQEPQVQGALLSIEVGTGDVIALVGGYDFQQSQFDRVTQAYGHRLQNHGQVRRD